MNDKTFLQIQVMKIITEITPSFSGNLLQPLSELILDSFDFLTLRAELQQVLGLIYTDEEWVEIKLVNDFIEFGRNSISENLLVKKQEVITKRKYKINMPQMATGGLGESWYYKEIGDMHWSLLAKSLGLDSDKILDEAGERLYATFVRIKYCSDSSFQEFSENEELSLDLSIGRYGAFFLSENVLCSNDKNITAQLVTSFVSRGKNNRDLKKSQPKEIVTANVDFHEQRPQFLEEYHQIRKKEVNEVELNNYIFKLDNKVFFETEYSLNPYTDLNGVNLLYFAAYPLIFDNCERQYVKSTSLWNEIEDDWGISASSLAKDIHYLGNADINDVLVFKLSTFEVKNNIVYSHASLYRKNDSELVAQIFSIKKIREMI